MPTPKRQSLTVSLEGLHVGFLQALAAQAGTSVDVQLGRMIEANLAQAVQAIGNVTVGPAAPRSPVPVDQVRRVSPRRPVTDDDVREMARLRDSGLSYGQIADRVGRNIASVWTHLKRTGR